MSSVATKRDTSKLQVIVAILRAYFERPTPPPASNAFQFVLWEQAAYLADDERRAGAFTALRRRVGLSPTAILEAHELLEYVRQRHRCRVTAGGDGLRLVDRRLSAVATTRGADVQGVSSAVRDLPDTRALLLRQGARGAQGGSISLGGREA